MLTGEADGVRKRPGQRALSGSFVIAGSGYYEVDAVREDSYAAKVAGEARQFRHPPSPLQEEVNQVLKACTWLLIPLAAILIFALIARDTPLDEAAQTATAGLITLIPEGLVLLMSVTLAVAAVRLARLDTLVQQMAATESLAAVDTICVDKTGTLTTGELRLVAIEVADDSESRGRAEGAGALRRQLGRAQPHPRGDRRALPRQRRAGLGRGARSRSEWKWSGLTLGGSARRDLRARRPGRDDGPRRAVAAGAAAEAAWRRTPARAAAWSPSAAPRAACPRTPRPSRCRRSPRWR